MLPFPAEPFAGRTPDGTYATELALAQRAGLDTALLDTETLLDGDLTRALRWLPRPGRPHPAIYRG